MAIDRKQVRHVARLARLALSDADEEKYAAQLSHVLGYIEQLAQVDVAGVQPLTFAGDASAEEAALALRADEPLPGLPRERALAAAPAHDESAFLVPRIIE
jgi:aspartyl-tRNA(Asn)/glutamyl-tRNA(Gln) amidotransferase subunit C